MDTYQTIQLWNDDDAASGEKVRQICTKRSNSIKFRTVTTFLYSAEEVRRTLKLIGRSNYGSTPSGKEVRQILTKRSNSGTTTTRLKGKEVRGIPTKRSNSGTTTTPCRKEVRRVRTKRSNSIVWNDDYDVLRCEKVTRVLNVGAADESSSVEPDHHSIRTP